MLNTDVAFLLAQRLAFHRPTRGTLGPAFDALQLVYPDHTEVFARMILESHFMETPVTHPLHSLVDARKLARRIHERKDVLKLVVAGNFTKYFRRMAARQPGELQDEYEKRRKALLRAAFDKAFPMGMVDMIRLVIELQGPHLHGNNTRPYVVDENDGITHAFMWYTISGLEKGRVKTIRCYNVSYAYHRKSHIECAVPCMAYFDNEALHDFFGGPLHKCVIRALRKRYTYDIPWNVLLDLVDEKGHQIDLRGLSRNELQVVALKRRWSGLGKALDHEARQRGWSWRRSLNRPLWMACHPEKFPVMERLLQHNRTEKIQKLMQMFHDDRDDVWVETTEETLKCARGMVRSGRLPPPPERLRVFYGASEPRKRKRADSVNCEPFIVKL